MAKRTDKLLLNRLVRTRRSACVHLVADFVLDTLTFDGGYAKMQTTCLGFILGVAWRSTGLFFHCLLFVTKLVAVGRAVPVNVGLALPFHNRLSGDL